MSKVIIKKFSEKALNILGRWLFELVGLVMANKEFFNDGFFL